MEALECANAHEYPAEHCADLAVCHECQVSEQRVEECQVREELHHSQYKPTAVVAAARKR